MQDEIKVRTHSDMADEFVDDKQVSVKSVRLEASETSEAVVILICW